VPRTSLGEPTLNQPTAKPRSTQLPPRDEVAALDSAGGDADLAAELFEALLAGLPGEIEDLHACLAEDDWPGLAEHAHQIRGATRYCGVPALDDAIEALERAARIGDRELTQHGFDQVQAESQRLQQAAG
jgi:HPt (histidine-containing phosphotransfer) domain-containing protein